MFLELGSAKKKGWITIDAYKVADFVTVVPPLPEEIKSMTFERVEAIHFWEHLYHWQALQLSKEIYDILIPGGKLVLEMPDLAKCCEFLIGKKEIPYSIKAPRNPDPRFTIWGIYGAQDDPEYVGNIHQAHKWGYTPDSIKDQLQRVGFKVKFTPTHCKKERDMRVEAIK